MPRKERREHPRIDALNLLSYLVIDRKGQIVTQGVGRTINVSEGGILLETHIPISPDHSVSLFLALEGDLVDVKGRIIHCGVNDEGKFNTGIAFDHSDKTAKEMIANYVQAFTEKKPSK